MAQNITLLGASYSDVPAVTLPKTGGGTATFTDVTDTTAAASDVASGKYFYTDAGVRTEGTASGGGGGSEEPIVIFIDYDGTILHEYTPTEFASLSALPANPSHTDIGLVSDGWNWTLAELQSQLTAMPYQCVVVGQMYSTASGATEINVSLDETSVLSPYVKVQVKGGSVNIDWGDGNTSTLTNNNSSFIARYDQHIYATTGDYTIKISAIGTAQYKIGGSSSYYFPLSGSSSESSSTQYIARKYMGKIRSIHIGNGANFAEQAFRQMRGITAITFPASLGSEINLSNMLYYAWSLKTVTLPRGVTSIGGYFAYYCKRLQYVSIPLSVTSIGTYAFYLSQLVTITLPKDMTSVGDQCFNNTFIKELYFPNGVTSIARFSNMNFLEKADLNKATSIGANAFESDYHLREITIPNTVTSIGGSAFKSTPISGIDIPSSVTSIGSSAFSQTKITSVNIPNNCTADTSAFASCELLEEATIPSNITVIPNSLFSGCSLLHKVTILGAVTKIGDYAFQNCPYLESITVPNTVTEIGQRSLSGFELMTSLTIPASVTTIKNEAFSYNYSMQEYHFLSTTPPTLGGSNVFSNIPSTCKIYVPAASLSDYQTAQYWSTHASKMVGE